MCINPKEGEKVEKSEKQSHGGERTCHEHLLLSSMIIPCCQGIYLGLTDWQIEWLHKVLVLYSFFSSFMKKMKIQFNKKYGLLPATSCVSLNGLITKNGQ